MTGRAQMFRCSALDVLDPVSALPCGHIWSIQPLMGWAEELASHSSQRMLFRDRVLGCVNQAGGDPECQTRLFTCCDGGKLFWGYGEEG